MLENTNLSTNIDSIDEVDIDKVKLSDLALKFRTSCSKARGFGPGRTVEYRAGIACALGNVAVDVWDALAEAVVARDLGPDFLAKTMQFVRDNGTPIETFNERAVRDTALTICTTEIPRGTEWEQYPAFENAVPEVRAFARQLEAC